MDYSEDFKFIIDGLLDMGHSMLTTVIDVHAKDGSFMCRACGLLFQGYVLAYNPTHDVAEWVQFKGITSDMTLAEEPAIVEMLDHVPTQKQAMEMRLDRIREIRTFNSSGGKDTAAKAVDDAAAEVADDTAAKTADDLKAETPGDPSMEGGEGFITEEDSALASKMEELTDGY